jgi:hypothetical protein
MTAVLTQEGAVTVGGKRMPLDVEGLLAHRQPRVVARYAAEHQVSLEEAEVVFQETKKFLAVCAVWRGEDFAPSEQQDEMWHNFILFTVDYTNFCKQFFGGYIHHVPCDGTRASTEGCPLKQKAVDIFGEITSELWVRGPDLRCCGYC